MRLYLTNDNVLRKLEEIGQLKNLVIQTPVVIPPHENGRPSERAG